MTMEEKEHHIESHYQLMRAMLIIDSVEQQIAVFGPANMTSLRQSNQEVYDAYFAIYQAGKFLCYMPDIPSEYLFIKSIFLEMDQVRHYKDFLAETQYKAQTMSDVSIFSDPDGFNTKNLIKTSDDFSEMNAVCPDFSPQKGLHTAINFVMTDLIILVIMLFIAFPLVRNEIDNGSILLIHTMPRGHLTNAFSKLVALAVSLLIVTTLLFGCNLLFCSATYGLGNLSAPIQSYYFLLRSTLRFNLLGYLCVFIFTKWIAIFTIGVWVLLACTLARTANGGYLLAMAFPLVCEFFRRLIPATSPYNMLKYANIASLVQTNEILGNYRNINVLNTPIQLFTVETISAGCYIIFLGCCFCTRFSHWQVRSVRYKSRLQQKRKQPRIPSLFAQEAYKVFIMNGGVLVLLVFLSIQILFVYNTQSYISPDEIYYRHYINVMEGPLTQEKLDWLNEQREEFRPLLELDAALQSGRIDAMTYASQMNMYVGLREKYNVYQQVYEEARVAAQTPGHQMIYANGYNQLFGFGNQSNLSECLIVCITLCVCCSSVFAQERQGSMKHVIATTPLGRKTIVSTKLVLCGSVSVGAGIISLVPKFVLILRDYWFSAPTAPLHSMDIFIYSPINIPVFFLIILMIAVRIIGCLAVTSVILFISEKTGNTIVSIVISSILFGLPSLLALCGIDSTKWIGIFPLFHFAVMMTDVPQTVFVFICLGIWSAASLFCIYCLYEEYPQNLYLEYGKGS